MLTRIITALLLLPLVVGLILFAPNWALESLILIVWLLALFEYLNFTKIFRNYKKNLIYLFLFLFMLVLIFLYSRSWVYIVYLTLVYWIAVALTLIYFKRFGFIYSNKIFVTISAFFIFVASYISCHILIDHFEDNSWILLICVAIWAIDSGAYFSGKYVGGRKLIPRVSPNKTVAGAIGGFIFGVLIIQLAAHLFSKFTILANSRTGYGLATVIFLAAIFGDLCQSGFKRAFDVKDSGKILPGHGGIYDRIDSMLAVFPTVVIWLYL